MNSNGTTLKCRKNLLSNFAVGKSVTADKKSTMKKYSKAFLKCIEETQITSVRVGKDRTKFTGIWMVEVDGRIFARSYNLAERSWYTSFLNGSDGDIKCGKEIIPVRGVKVADNNIITA